LICRRGPGNIFKEKGASGVISPGNALLFSKEHVAHPPRLCRGKAMGAGRTPNGDYLCQSVLVSFADS
jgi:hypothetical protein